MRVTAVKPETLDSRVDGVGANARCHQRRVDAGVKRPRERASPKASCVSGASSRRVHAREEARPGTSGRARYKEIRTKGALPALLEESGNETPGGKPHREGVCTGNMKGILS